MQVEESAKQRKQLILVGLLACAVGVYFYVDRAPPPGPTPSSKRRAREGREGRPGRGAQAARR